MKPKKAKFKTNTLYYYANEYRKRLTEEDDLEKIDMTQTFYEELEYMISEGEIIIININAKMRLGKSTCAFSIADNIYELLKKYKYKPKNTSFGITNIARDHQEYSKMMRDPKLAFTVVVTDEENQLENTGENVTAENALTKVFSDVQAGRYVHRVCCSPKETTDPNADILLSVVAIDKKTNTTHCKLYYKFYEGGTEHIQLLGYVNINVEKTIKIWNKIKKHYNKPNRNKQDKEIIQKAKEKDWYVEYIIRKYEKMELITKHGIFKPRVLDYAEIILTVINELKVLTKQHQLLNKDIIRNFVKSEFRKAKIPTSIVGEELATRETSAVLEMYKSIHATNRKLQEIRKLLENKKMGETTYQIENETLTTIKEKLTKSLQQQINELEHYKNINEKYHKLIKREEQQ